MRLQDKLDGEVLRDIGFLLKKLRKSNNFTQNDLALKVGVNRKLIGDIENGSNTSFLIIIRLLKIYNRLDKVEDLLFSNNVSPKKLFTLKKNK